ncbi:MAG: geranylgeranylglycerol-phosphate geranylgeranyltransferase [Paludibacter sp.]|nr:geranylgeranylglycerol-phosphate geranylgeranyltransferase [Paludibacter sp.]
MTKYFRLVRLPNLIFLAAIQILIYFAVIQPIMQIHGFESAQQNSTYFWLLVAASVLICAGGYVLNDYFDVKIDSINKPDKLMITNVISKKSAMFIYQILSGAGLIAGLILAVLLKSFTLGFIFIVTVGLLWFYSASYKRQFIIGNLIVAFLSAISVLSVGILKMAILQKIFGNLIFETHIPPMTYLYVGGFAVFAFLTTWLREIIKDIEDEPGDREMECHTMAIKWGITRTKIFIYMLIILIIIALFVCAKLISFQGTLTFRYILIGIIIPLLVLAYMIFSAKEKKEFHQAATFAKVIMLVGILYSLIFYFEIAKMFKIPFFDLFFVK